MLSLLVLQKIPVAKAVEMVLAGDGEEQSQGIVSLYGLWLTSEIQLHSCSSETLEPTTDLFTYRA